MSNVMQFPGGRRLPPKPTADALLDELRAAELELVRARIAQVRSETRQAQALWGWWCFKRAVIWGLVLWLLITFAKAAERKQFFNANGSFAGSSTVRGSSGQYYDGAGRFSGSSLRSGNQTLYYDHQGRFSGSTTGPQR